MAWWQGWSRNRRRPTGLEDGVLSELEHGHQVGEYCIERKLGAGGFGAVYQAIHPVIGKRAAVKVLHARYSTNPEMVSRFISEARAVNQIRHHSIVDIFAFGVLDDGRHYYVMELLEGVPLDLYLEQVGRVPVEEALAILQPVARALEAAHGAGIAHRDLKPENVFLELTPEGGVFPHILDFGVAKLLADKRKPQAHKTRTGVPIGSPRYMSPEQCQGVEVDPRTDEYAFGVIVHRMLTGELPFDAKTAFDLMLMHVGAEPPAMSSVCPTLDPAFDAPVLKMLSKNPEDRYPSIREAFQELEKAALATGHDAQSWSGLGPKATEVLVSLAETRVGARSDTEGFREGLAREPSQGGSQAWKWRSVALGGALLIVSTGVVLVLNKRAHEPLERLTQEARRALEDAVAQGSALSPSAVPVIPATVGVTLRTRPQDAEVYWGELRLGNAPGPVFLPVSSAPVVLTLKAPGYAATTVEVVPSASATVGATLKPAQKPVPDRTVPKDLEYPY